MKVRHVCNAVKLLDRLDRYTRRNMDLCNVEEVNDAINAAKTAIRNANDSLMDTDVEDLTFVDPEYEEARVRIIERMERLHTYLEKERNRSKDEYDQDEVDYYLNQIEEAETELAEIERKFENGEGIWD